MAKAKFDLKKALAMATKKHLASAKEKAGSGGFEEFDDGKYVMRCEGGELGQSASSDRFQATMFWRFIGGDYNKKPYRSYQGLDTEDGWTYFLRDLGRLGYDTTELESFEEVLPILKELKKEKPTARVSLKTNGEFQNLRIQRLLDEDEIEEEDGEDEEEETPKKKTKKKSSKKDEDEEEEESDDDEEESDDDEESEDEEESDDDEESDDEEEEEAPAKKKGAKKKPAKKKAKADDDEEEESDDDEEESDDDEDAEDEVALSIGSTVKVRTKAGVKKGEVTEVLEDDNKIKVKFSDGKSLTLSAEKIVSVEDVPSKKKVKAPVAAKKKAKK
jgi:hypothetical protein